MLTRAGLRDDPLLAHAGGQERLPEHVVDLVRARVAEVLALEEDARPAAGSRQPLGEVERRRPAGVMGEEILEPEPEAGIGATRAVGPLELDERRHERLGDEAPAEAAEVAGGVRERGRVQPRGRHCGSHG